MLDTLDNPRAVIGGNNPPPRARAEILAERHAALIAEVDAIAARADGLPKAIRDELQLGRLGDVVKDARGLAGRLDKLRKDEVEPHLTAQRETNAYFATFADRLKALVDRLSQRATDYQAEVEAERRRKADEEAAKLRAAQDAAREKAQAAHEAGKSAATVQRHEDAANLAGARAERAERESDASAADLTRTRSDSGTLATTKTTWDFEITDASKVPLEMLRPYIPRADLEKFIRAHVKNNRDTVQLGGVRIFQNKKAAFR